MTYYEEILKVIAEKGPLNAKMISQLTDASNSTVRHYLMYMRKAGQIRRYKGIRGLYEITERRKKELS